MIHDKLFASLLRGFAFLSLPLPSRPPSHHHPTHPLLWRPPDLPNSQLSSCSKMDGSLEKDARKARVGRLNGKDSKKRKTSKVNLRPEKAALTFSFLHYLLPGSRSCSPTFIPDMNSPYLQLRAPGERALVCRMRPGRRCNAGLPPALEVPSRHAREQREERYRKAKRLLDARAQV